jgi:hypothetical protein
MRRATEDGRLIWYRHTAFYRRVAVAAATPPSYTTRTARAQRGRLVAARRSRPGSFFPRPLGQSGTQIQSHEATP